MSLPHMVGKGKVGSIPVHFYSLSLHTKTLYLWKITASTLKRLSMANMVSINVVSQIYSLTKKCPLNVPYVCRIIKWSDFSVHYFHRSVWGVVGIDPNIVGIACGISDVWAGSMYWLSSKWSEQIRYELYNCFAVFEPRSPRLVFITHFLDLLKIMMLQQERMWCKYCFDHFSTKSFQ